MNSSLINIIQFSFISFSFSYFYKFNKKGKYTIKYIFKKYMTKTNYIFRECSSLTNINLSNFNTNNVTDMRGMYRGCSSLTNINLSNFNTNKVTDMSDMFYECSSLKKENIIAKDERILTEFKNK